MDYPTKGIAVDASCSGNPGPVEYRGVDLESGEIVFTKSFPLGTNNIGEFLAVASAIRLFPGADIYTDSITAIAWTRNKTAKSTMKRGNTGAFEILQAVFQAEKWLRTNKYTNEVIHWPTREFGEIPADFGKKN